MATELERLEVLIKADIATPEDKKRYAELLAEAPPAPIATVPQTGAIDFEDEVDVVKFKEGGERYYMPSEEGFHKSKLVEVVKPSFGEKDLKIFNFETDDPKLKSQGRGAIWVEMSKGAFSLKTILDGIGIPYTLEGSKVKYSISFPHPCYANWSMDPKGRASGNVLITGLRTLEAGAAVEKAI